MIFFLAAAGTLAMAAGYIGGGGKSLRIIEMREGQGMGIGSNHSSFPVYITIIIGKGAGSIGPD
ncbi:hypothetical protein GCM10022394_19800 [Zobellella aerophila]|uniref:Uncharacterized protein n=1 Tax=Zobellella aerophila TaxID=870480 RepID=A0ABP6VSK4_9GAMM